MQFILLRFPHVLSNNFFWGYQYDLNEIWDFTKSKVIFVISIETEIDFIKIMNVSVMSQYCIVALLNSQMLRYSVMNHFPQVPPWENIFLKIPNFVSMETSFSQPTTIAPVLGCAAKRLIPHRVRPLRPALNQ